MRIALIRHPPLLIEPGICYGRLDVAVDPASDEPIRQLAADAELRGAARVWTSPSRRCRGLAAAIATVLAVPLSVDPRLHELDFGRWEGRAWDTMERADLDRWAECPIAFAPPGGESGAELIARVNDFHAELQRDQQSCVVVSHGGPLKLLTAMLRGGQPDLLATAPPMGSLTIVTCAGAASPA